MQRTYKCPKCQNKFSQSESTAVDRISCSHCQTVFRLPNQKNPVAQREPAETLLHANQSLDETIDSPVRHQKFRSRLSLGGSFGDYELLEEIGRGGMGVIYKARQKSLQRMVALKMILTGHLASDEEVQRFHEEAQAAATLSHPGIVPIYEIGSQDGQQFFSMAFIAGESLSQRLSDNGPMTPIEAAGMAKQLCDAITHAHELGVIHRDLKPANILLEESGAPRITDFGLAKRVEADGELTATGQILGTPSYMAPEQARGEVVSESADIYALGAILYALLTGQPPFRAANPVDTIKQVIDQDPVDPRQINNAIPQDLNTICLACLQKEPRKRYPTALALSNDLQQFIDNRPIIARRATRVDRLRRWTKREPVVAALAFGIIFVSLTAGAISTFFAFQAVRSAKASRINESKALAAKIMAENRQKQLAIMKQQLEERNQNLSIALRKLEQKEEERRLAAAAAAREEGQRKIAMQVASNERKRAKNAAESAKASEERTNILEYQAQIRRAHSALKANDKAQALTLLEACTTSLRSFEWYYLKAVATTENESRPAAGRQWNVFTHDLPVQDIAIGPKGKRMALVDGHGGVRVWNPATVKETVVASEGNAFLRSVVFDTTGERLAAAGKSADVQMWDLQSGERKQFRGATKGTRKLVFTPNALVAGGEDGTIRFWSLRLGTERVFPDRHEGAVRSLDFGFLTGTAKLPMGGILLASVGEDGILGFWSENGLEGWRKISAPGFSSLAVNNGPEGGLFMGRGARLPMLKYHLSLRDNHVKRSVDITRQVKKKIDDEWRMVTETKPESRVFYAGTTIRMSRGIATEIFGVGTQFAISPDGRWLATDSGTDIQIWDLKAEQAISLIEGAHQGRITAIRWSPDAQWLLTGRRSYRQNLGCF